MPMPPLESMNCSRGAPMGRSNRCEMGADAVGQVYLQRVPFIDGCYDRGGAYWGAPANLWRAYAEIEWAEDEHIEEEPINIFDQPARAGDIEVFEHFLRANSREQAKAALREEFPNIRFYR